MVIKTAKEKLSAFKSEFRAQVSTALITAFGLVIALAWKDVVVDIMTKLNPSTSLIPSAIIVTAFGIIGIAIISKWAKKPEPEKDSNK